MLSPENCGMLQYRKAAKSKSAYFYFNSNPKAFLRAACIQPLLNRVNRNKLNYRNMTLTTAFYDEVYRNGMTLPQVIRLANAILNGMSMKTK